MKPNITFSILLFCISSKAVGQEPKLLRGKILVRDALASGVVILNLNSQSETFSKENGYFSIAAATGDVLLFHAPNLDDTRKIIEEDDFGIPYVEIAMTSKIEQLAEVEVVNYKIDAVSARILSAPAKQYTPAQRRLKTAGDFKPIHLLGLLGGSLPLDPILNAINGRTAKLKKEISVEHRELLLEKIGQYYDDAFFREKLHIPAGNIGGFKYYIIENPQFEHALLAKNHTLMFFEMSKMAPEYVTLIASEKP